MANENFGKNDHKWRVQVGENSSRLEHEFWGDEYNWNTLAPILWGTVDHPRIRVQPPRVDGDIVRKAAWWQGALHLLVFGMGWVDVAKGLHNWREDGYPTDNHVLRAVYNTYGPSIEGLELWLKASHDWRWSFCSAMRLDELALVQWDRAEVDRQRELFALRLTSGPRHHLAEGFMPEGGSDTFHISGHFPSVVRIQEDSDVDPGWLYEEKHASVVLESYNAWTHHTIRGLEMFYGDLSRLDKNFSVEVSIVSLGSLGRFSVGPKTGRLFRTSYGQGNYDRDHLWHLAGN